MNSHKSSSYTQSLIEKYEDNYPCWVFFEIISFGDLTKFCHFYYNEYHVKVIDSRLLNNVRDLRNAAAHNNCLIKNLRIGNNIPLTPISNFVKNITTINKATRQRKLTNKFLYDFVVLIYVHNLIVSDNDKFNKLIDFLNNRILNNKSYFENVPLFKSSYDFIKKIVDYLLSL